MAPMRRPGRVQVTVSADELEAWRRSHQQRERAVQMLKLYERQGTVLVAVEDVLDLLGQDPEAPQEARKVPVRDPLDDPLTGARWAGPPGTSPPWL
jgi:hypothetical protein